MSVDMGRAKESDRPFTLHGYVARGTADQSLLAHVFGNEVAGLQIPLTAVPQSPRHGAGFA
ncbi:MAG TPA: hypothetical protein VIH65_04210, partial [Xanthobacteraceae bacterium]